MTQQNPYAAHFAFIAPARARSESWRVACVILGVFATFFVSPSLIVALAPNEAAVTAFYDATTPVTTLLQLLLFAFVLGALIVLVWQFHGRTLSSVLGADHRFRHQLTRVAMAVVIVLAVQEPLFLWMDRFYIEETRDLGQWAFWVLPAIFALLIQVGTEEVFFRGYLQQQLAVLSSSRWIWMVLPSLFFGIAHLPNANNPVEAVFWVFWAGLLGLACADLTARTGNLGAAIGLHLANNIFALLIVAVSGAPVSGLALFLYPASEIDDQTLGLIDLFDPAMLFQFVLSGLSIFVMWMAARLTLRL